MFTIEILNTPENKTLLEYFKSLFNGNVTVNGNLIRFRVTAVQDLIKVREFFKAYPLGAAPQTTKSLNFDTWCKI